MEHDGYSSVRIEGSSSKSRLRLIGISFIVAFVVFLGIGALGPSVWVIEGTQESKYYLLQAGKLTPIILGDPRIIKKENQIFAIQSRISAPNFNGIDNSVSTSSTSLNIVLSVTADKENIVDDEYINRDVKCSAGEEWCNWLDLLTVDLVDAETYIITGDIEGPESWTVKGSDGKPTLIEEDVRISVQTRAWYIDSAYTRFEMGWKYFFLLITLIVLLTPRYGFLSAIKRIRREMWSFQQKWTLRLLICLVLFNDSFFALRIYSTGKVQLAFTCIYILCVLIFMFAILLWWLLALSDLRSVSRSQDNQTSSSRTSFFWLPKILLVLAIVLVNLAAFFYYRYNKYVSPVYDGVSDSSYEAKIFAGFLGVLMCIYLIWCIVLIVSSCRYVSSLSPGYKFLYGITFLTLVISIIGVFTAAFYPWSTSAVTFLGFHGLYNIYVWTLAYAYAPVFSLSREEEFTEHEMVGSFGGQKGPGHLAHQHSMGSDT